ncbi:MAG: EutN/CcmL family microcompartment protein [Pirellulales bacterium]
MRIGKVIGTVTLSTAHPALLGARYCVVTPQSLANLDGTDASVAEELIVYDDLGPGLGATIAFSEGGEAAQPFRPDNKPIDAYCAAILDHIHID